MKTKFFCMSTLLASIAIFFSFALFSCASSTKETWPSIEPSSFIGTKWTSAKPELLRMSLEIINDKECYYTLGYTIYLTPYTINRNIITLPAFHITFELRGNTFYDSKGTPIFVKE